MTGLPYRLRPNDKDIDKNVLERIEAAHKPPYNKPSQLDELLQDRNKTHGPFKLQAAAAVELKHVMKKYLKDTVMSAEHTEALDMIAHKLARIIIGHAGFKDHWDDIAGYAQLGSKACED